MRSSGNVYGNNRHWNNAWEIFLTSGYSMCSDFIAAFLPRDYWEYMTLWETAGVVTGGGESVLQSDCEDKFVLFAVDKKDHRLYFECRSAQDLDILSWCLRESVQRMSSNEQSDTQEFYQLAPTFIVNVYPGRSMLWDSRNLRVGLNNLQLNFNFPIIKGYKAFPALQRITDSSSVEETLQAVNDFEDDLCDFSLSRYRDALPRFRWACAILACAEAFQFRGVEKARVEEMYQEICKASEAHRAELIKIGRLVGLGAALAPESNRPISVDIEKRAEEADLVIHRELRRLGWPKWSNVLHGKTNRAVAFETGFRAGFEEGYHKSYCARNIANVLGVNSGTALGLIAGHKLPEDTQRAVQEVLAADTEADATTSE